MSRRFLYVLLGVLSVSALHIAPAQQQPIAPHIGYLYPAGGRRGATVEVTLGGQYLNGAQTVYVSGKGVSATILRNIRPMTGREIQALREQVQQLAEKRQSGKITPDEQKTLLELRARLTEATRPPSSPAIAENAILQFTIAPDAAPGEYAVRLDTAAGLTNPVMFRVGDLPEFTRPWEKVPLAFVVVNGAMPPQRPRREPEKPGDITLPAVVNGQVMPGITDRYRFHASWGQRIVVSAAARELIPYISDAVPGWFQAVITLRDAGGKVIATADHFRFHPDPALACDIPSDGTYTLEIHDSIYRGREDFVYRVTIGDVPYATDLFPLGGKAGTRAKIETRGWNLPGAAITQNLKGRQPGLTFVDGLPFAVDTLPETTVRSAAKPQRIKLPAVINGRIARPGETHVFRIDARGPEEIEAEVFARRLGSPLDSVLRLTDAAGHELAANDDFEDKGAGLLTHQADSRIICKLPAKGSYYLRLGDNERKGGPEYAYRLRVTRPRPDFELRVVPASVNIRAGATMPLTVYALRRGGFTGEIALQLKDVPRGFALSGAIIPAGQDQVRMTITAPPGRVDVPMAIQLEGRAGDLHHLALPAEDMMQAFYYRHLVVQPDWMVRVVGAGGAPVRWNPNEKPVRITAGATGQIQLAVPPRLVSMVRLSLSDPPDGLVIEKMTPGPNNVTIVLRADSKLKAGMKGNLIFDASIKRPNAPRAQPIGVVPAIPFEVVP